MDNFTEADRILCRDLISFRRLSKLNCRMAWDVTEVGLHKKKKVINLEHFEDKHYHSPAKEVKSSLIIGNATLKK